MVIVASDCVAIHDFADVFGRLPVQPSIEPYLCNSKELICKGDEVGIDEFEVMKVVGRGAFGKVYQVRKRGSPDEICAMKVMRKDMIVEKGHAEYIVSEKEILMKVDHPFIVKLRYSFQVRFSISSP